MSDDIAIKVEGVYKDFNLPHERSGTVKGAFTNMFRHATIKNEKQHALKNISFEVKKGEFFGIVGRNGSGKSTLLKILAGIYQPTRGKITTSGKLIPFIELGVGFNGELSGKDNVYLNGAMLGFSKNEINEMYEDIVNFAELERFMDQKLKNYSSGMQVRLAFSLATRAKAEILLVDEVLAVGDADFQKKCFKYFRELKELNKTVIFVSHDMNSVEEYCDRAILIEKSEIIVSGSTHDASAAYTRMFMDQDLKNNKLSIKKKRWGNNKLVYKSATINKQLIEGEENFYITTVIKAQKDVPEIISGFKIRPIDDEKPIFGNNNKLKKQNIFNVKKGDEITLKWIVPNILNTGVYSVDLVIQGLDKEMSGEKNFEIFDWWDDSIVFSVDKNEDSAYSINPIVGLGITK